MPQEDAAQWTRETVRQLLEQEGYDALLYNLDGRKDRIRNRWDAHVVLDRWSNRWVVYDLDERGGKRDIRKYRTEDEACRDLLSRLHRPLGHSDTGQERPAN